MLRAIAEEHVHEVFRQHAERIAGGRGEDEQFLDLVFGLGFSLQGDGARAEAIRVEIEILRRGFAPDFVVQVAGLRGPANMDAGVGGFDDLDAAAAQFFVRRGVHAIYAVFALGGLGELEVQRGVVLPGPEGRVGRAAPEDEARAVWQRDDDILALRCPGLVIGDFGDFVRAGIGEERVVVAQLRLAGSEQW